MQIQQPSKNNIDNTAVANDHKSLTRPAPDQIVERPADTEKERGSALATWREVLVRLSHLIDHAVLLNVVRERHPVGVSWTTLLQLLH